MTSSGADSSSSPTKIDSTVSFSTSETPATNYLAKKWHRKLINEEQPLMRRPRSETIPTQQQHQLFHSSSSDAMPTLRNAPGSASVAPPFGSGIFNTITPWSDMSQTQTTADQQLLREDHHIASTFASLNLDEDRDNTRRTIHTSHSYSSLQLFAENQNDVQIKRPPSVMDLRFQGNRPRAMSAVDRHQPQETYPFQNIWRPSVEDNRRPFLRNSTSSADLLEAMTRQRKVATGAASASPVIYDENYTNWENMASFETDLVDLSLSSSGQAPSRSLWIGQLDPTITKNELNNLFSKFGTIESIRILPDRECAFINYFGVEEALRARDALVSKMGCQLGNTTVKVGFGKLEAVLPLGVENTQEPTRALWIGNIPNNTTQTILGTIFSTFGAIESIRLLPHKNCAFVNFFNSEDAVRAKRALHNREIMGPGTGIVKIGFAKVPLLKAAEDESFVAEPKEQQQEMVMYMMNEMMNDPNMISAIIAERKMIMQDFGEDEKDGPMFQGKSKMLREGRCVHLKSFIVLHLPEQYFHTIPAAPELGQSRKVDISKLRDIKKRMDTGHISVKELEVIAMECFDELVELCSDYIGNTVIQRLFERCSEMTKSIMLERVAPYLGSIGVHKNGTWAAQKIIDTAKLPTQINLICESIKPYVPALLLDKFGNYVVQCCLTLGPSQNQFIFDAIVDSCWEIAQGRFGARAVRATLECPHVTKRQQKYVAASLVQHALLLSTNANGALLLIWLLDTSGIPGRYRVLAPRLLPHLAHLCTHKLASLTVLKLINQRQEPDARNIILDALFFTPQSTEVIEEILHDQIHGVSLVQKILSSSYIELRERQRIAERVRQILQKLKLQHVQSYKRLIEEINMVMVDSVPGASLGAGIPSQFSISPSLAAAMHAKYLAVSQCLGQEDSLDQPQSTAAMMTNFYAAAAAAAIATNSNTEEKEAE